MEDSALERIQWLFRFFAEREAKGSSPLYYCLSLGIDHDDALIALAGSARPGQPVPNLLFAAVHYLLQGGVKSVTPLRDFYPNLTDAPNNGDPLWAFREFCEEHDATIRHLLQTRLVQTNEVQRSAILLTGLASVLAAAAGSDSPLALIDVGTSAGLNLFVDRHHYRYGDLLTWGDPNAALHLTCALRGDHLPHLPDGALRIASRIGLDLNPIDIRDDDAVRWLRALIWPEHTERFHRLDAAIAIARQEPPTILGGDALAHLSQVLDATPAEVVPCVCHSFTVNQFSNEMRETLHVLLREAATRRGGTVYRVSIEATSGEPYPFLSRIEYRSDGSRTESILARCDPHGRWLEWFGDANEGPVTDRAR